MYTNRVQNRPPRQGRLPLKSLPREGQGLSTDTACCQDNQRANQTASCGKLGLLNRKTNGLQLPWYGFQER